MTSFRHFFRHAALLAVLTCGLAAQPAAATEPPVFAEGWSFSRFFSNINNRTRVIQFCAAAMALGLFILMKKFAGADSCQGTTARPTPMTPLPSSKPVAASVEQCHTRSAVQGATARPTPMTPLPLSKPVAASVEQCHTRPACPRATPR